MDGNARCSARRRWSQASARARWPRNSSARGARSARCRGGPSICTACGRKMQGKGTRDSSPCVPISRALRVIVDDLPDCYAALARVHERCTRPCRGEFDDYIAKPKPNGYQSLHTVDARPRRARPLESADPHARHARPCRARRWRALGLQGSRCARLCRRQRRRGDFEERVAEARQARCCASCMAWEREVSRARCRRSRGRHVRRPHLRLHAAGRGSIELPAGGDAGGLCLHACTPTWATAAAAPRVDGALVPLYTATSRNGQTVEIIAAKEGGPSRDWLNAGALATSKSQRARAPRCAPGFNAQAAGPATIARGRELVEKLLQREGQAPPLKRGRTWLSNWASSRPTHCSRSVGQGRVSRCTQIENLLRPPAHGAARPTN